MEAPVQPDTAHVDMRVPLAASSVSVIRRALRRWMTEQGAEDGAIDDASVVVSELVANSVRHARPLADGSIVVSWVGQGRDLVVSVTDGGSTTTPHKVDAPVSATSGRGMTIVESLSSRWWLESAASRSTVHTVLPLH